MGLKGTQLPLPMPKPKWPKRSARLVTALMCKNERAQIAETTLDSLKEYCGHLIVYDTGSTDGTQNHIREYCAKNDIQLDLKEGPFVDFAVSRNVLLDYCDELLKGQDDKFILQVDAHDVLQGGDKLIEFITTFKGPQTGFYLTQKWWSGSNLDSYYNVRMIKPHKEWRYNPDAIVHEYIVSPAMEKDPGNAILKTEGIILYQDRTAQGDSSFRRFMRDKEMLFRKYLEKPAEPRTLFYLAQTQGCLGLNEEAYKFYQLRIKQQGFFEEIYHSYFRLGDLSVALGHNWEESMNWYWRAFQHSQRAEPLVRIAEYYEKHNLQGEDKPEWHSSYMYAQMACQLAWPQNQILFRDLACYTYKRYHLLGIAGYYVGRYREGKEACLKAIEARNLDVDKGNLRFYLEKEIEIFNNGKLDSPSVFASTFGETEIRTKEEIEINHDRTKIMNEIFSQILGDYTKQGKVISTQTLQSVEKLNNGLVINASQKGNSNSKTEMENVMYGDNLDSTSKRNTRDRLKKKFASSLKPKNIPASRPMSDQKQLQEQLYAEPQILCQLEKSIFMCICKEDNTKLIPCKLKIDRSNNIKMMVTPNEGYELIYSPQYVNHMFSIRELDINIQSPNSLISCLFNDTVTDDDIRNPSFLSVKNLNSRSICDKINDPHFGPFLRHTDIPQRNKKCLRILSNFTKNPRSMRSMSVSELISYVNKLCEDKDGVFFKSLNNLTFHILENVKPSEIDQVMKYITDNDYAFIVHSHILGKLENNKDHAQVLHYEILLTKLRHRYFTQSIYLIRRQDPKSIPFLNKYSKNITNFGHEEDNWINDGTVIFLFSHMNKLDNEVANDFIKFIEYQLQKSRNLTLIERILNYAQSNRHITELYDKNHELYMDMVATASKQSINDAMKLAGMMDEYHKGSKNNDQKYNPIFIKKFSPILPRFQFRETEDLSETENLM